MSKSETTGNVWRRMYEEMISVYVEYVVIFTDGSKQECEVGAAARLREQVKRASLLKVASIYNAKLVAMQPSLGSVESSPAIHFVIASDSQTAIKSIPNTAGRGEILQRIRHHFSRLMDNGKRIVLSWVPSHINIEENERTDRIAKKAACRPEELLSISFRDCYPNIRRRTYERWMEVWQNVSRDLRNIKQSPGRWRSFGKMTRREEVVINRLRLEHTRLTHKYLFESAVEWQRPMCGWGGDAVLTVKHILIKCSALKEARSKIFENTAEKRERERDQGSNRGESKPEGGYTVFKRCRDMETDAD